jgi:oligo-1,6-glucosidase
MLLPNDEHVYAFTRSLDGVELLTLGNFTGESMPVDLPGWAGTELVLGNYPPDGNTDTLVLRPWEARVYRRTP